MAFGYNSISPTQRTLQLSNYPRELARRLRRPASRIQETALPVLSERTIDTLYDTTDISVPAPSRSILTFDAPPPVPRRLVTSQDLIVGNQRPRPAPASPRTPRRQLKTSPYRRQAVSIAVKVSPSAATKRGRYTRERAKARVQSKKLVAKFSNMGTIDQASAFSETPLMATSKGKGMEIEQDISINAYDKTKNTVKDAIELNTPTLPTNTSAANASGKSTARSPSRIPHAIPQQHRSGSSSLSVRRRSSLNHDKLKSLTAGQLLRRMNKTLLGTSRPPVLTRTIVQKGVPSSIRLASRRPAAGGVLSTVTAEPLISPPSTTSLSSPAVTPTSTIATEPIADSAAEQTTPLVATVAKVRMTTKSSVKSADPVKSQRVTRSTLVNRFRRVTRSTTAAASQIL
ncbi:hypothetical protein BGZ97_004751 [Linnemannia gamsii]|uniref:Uncharacterized protein n=1 Tax=Linnemannia gamsii TaxID=64522 RepID=A0A9P6RDL0_9FUNG|nr:hypothetical protein BGZ97_004751 [Linnemannia gamsii]